MKLYCMPGACSLADHIVLEWVGADYELKKLEHDQIKQDWFLKLNPAGAVPVLVLDDDRVLTQNVAILHYLADIHPQPALAGMGTAESRAEVNRWLGFLNADMHPAFKPLFGATGYLEDKDAIDKTRDNARETLRGLFQRVDQQLGRHEWLAETRSITDPYLFVMTRWAKSMKVDLSGLDKLDAWFGRMQEDPGVTKALRDEGLD